jgi:hypothetical protein
MARLRKYFKYIVVLAVITSGYVTSFAAFWWLTGGFGYSHDRVSLWVDRITMIVNMPGWLSFSQGVGTPFTRVFISVISGTFWALLGLLVLKLAKTLRAYLRVCSHPNRVWSPIPFAGSQTAGEVPAQLTPHSLARSSARFPPDSSDLHWQHGRQSANALRERVAGREQGEQQSQPTTPGYFVGSSDRVVKRVSILKPNLKSTLCARNLLQINYRSQ